MANDLMLAVVPRVINGRRYRITRLDAWSMLDSIAELRAVAGDAVVASLQDPAVAEAMSALSERGDAGILPALGSLLAPALAGFVDVLGRASGKTGRDLLVRLGRQTEVEYREADRWEPLTEDRFARWFAVHAADLQPWIWAQLEVQFRDFFEPEIRAIGDLRAAPDPATSPSPPASPRTGPCGDA